MRRASSRFSCWHRSTRPHGSVLMPNSVERGVPNGRASVGATEPTSLEPVSAHGPYPRYEPGEYEAECVSASIRRDPQFRTWKADLRFCLLPDGEPIWGFLNLGRGEKPHAGRRSEYWRVWVIANGAQPLRRQTLTVRAFKGKIFKVRVADVTRRSDGRDHLPEAVYSTVHEILQRTYP